MVEAQSYIFHGLTTTFMSVFVLLHLKSNCIATRSQGAQMNTCVVVIYITISSNGMLFICSAPLYQIGKAILLVMSRFSELDTV